MFAGALDARQLLQQVVRFDSGRRFDVNVVDGAVKGAGAIVASWAGMMRRLQTGSVRSYAGSMFVGVVVILGYYLWK